MEKSKIDVPFEITQEFIDDVLCTAFEGGITHWCDKVVVRDNDYKGGEYASEVVSRGGVVDIVVDDGEFIDIDEYKEGLNLERFINGYKLYTQWCLDRKIEILTDPAEIDAEIADIIVQFAVFGEIIFG